MGSHTVNMIVIGTNFVGTGQLTAATMFATNSKAIATIHHIAAAALDFEELEDFERLWGSITQ